MKIIVPSLGRAGTAASMRWLMEANRNITFAVHSHEFDEYAKAYESRHTKIGRYNIDIDILALSDDSCKHTGLVRQEIMHHVREPFFFVDDDIRISLKQTSSIKIVFDILEAHIKAGASMAGLAPQLYSNFANPELINGDHFAVRNKFVATVYAIDPLAFDTCPLEKLPVYEDIALVIHAIQQGGGTIVSYVATHNNVSPIDGGCNSWRNKDITIQSLETLVALYPDICSIRPTTNTTHSQHIGIGLRTAWAKIKKLEA